MDKQEIEKHLAEMDTKVKLLKHELNNALTSQIMLFQMLGELNKTHSQKEL
jgi:hypothetical protein